MTSEIFRFHHAKSMSALHEGRREMVHLPPAPTIRTMPPSLVQLTEVVASEVVDEATLTSEAVVVEDDAH